MSVDIPKEAIEVAARVFYIGWDFDVEDEDTLHALATTHDALAAAYPVIERQIREQIADELMRRSNELGKRFLARSSTRDYDQCEAFATASALARGGQDG